MRHLKHLLCTVSILCGHVFASQLSGVTAQNSGDIAAQKPVHARIVPSRIWNIIDPVQAGWSREKLDLAHQYADSIHSASVMIVQNGRVVEEWGDVDKKITTFSVRKSLISGLYGVYSARSVIDINKTLEQVNINDSPDPPDPRRASGPYRRSAPRPLRGVPCRQLRTRLPEEGPPSPRQPCAGNLLVL